MADWCALSTERKQKIKKKYVLQDRHGALATSIFGMKGQNLLRIISSMRLRRSQSICPGLIRPSLILPKFEERLWFQLIQGDKLSPIPSELILELSKDKTPKAVFVDTLIANSSNARPRVEIKRDNAVYRSHAALIQHVLDGFSPGTTVSFLAPAALTTARSDNALRDNIDKEHEIQWLIYADGRLVPGVHRHFNFVILVVAVGAGPAKLTRLVDLRNMAPNHWIREIQAAKKRGGGEVGKSIVLRDTRLGCTAWTYERWTKDFSDSISDSQELGALRPLGELMDSIVVGINPSRATKLFQPFNEENDCADGFVPVISGREVTLKGIRLPGQFQARIDEVPENMVVSEGDLLLRSLVSPGPSGPRVVGAIVPAGLVAILGGFVLRLRWKPEVKPQARDLLITWILSERASKSLKALGINGIQINPSDLIQLQVPNPSESIVTALDKLSEYEQWHQERADSIRITRQEVFSADQYSEAVPFLLRTQQVEGECITAAVDSQKFDYRVRNYYPHPIALRRERLQILEHGKLRLEDNLDCAEYVIHFLALCGLVQLKVIRSDENPPSRHLTSTIIQGRLRFSWGSSWSLLKESVEATRKIDPLLTPIPQLSMLAESLFQKESGPGKAEAKLRKQRNNQSHLHRLPDPELVEISKRMSEALDELLEAVGFLADIPLVYVRDYCLDGLTEKRMAKLDFLRGSSVVFERTDHLVDQEIPRGDLGLISKQGIFYSLAPWLAYHNCSLCKRPEIFLFNRCDSRQATFVAMETGHAWESKNISSFFQRILKSPTDE